MSAHKFWRYNILAQLRPDFGTAAVKKILPKAVVGGQSILEWYSLTANPDGSLPEGTIIPDGNNYGQLYTVPASGLLPPWATFYYFNGSSSNCDGTGHLPGNAVIAAVPKCTITPSDAPYGFDYLTVGLANGNNYVEVTVPSNVMFEFPIEQEILEFKITVPSNAHWGYWPQRFLIEYSDNGTDWTVAYTSPTLTSTNWTSSGYAVTVSTVPDITAPVLTPNKAPGTYRNTGYNSTYGNCLTLTIAADELCTIYYTLDGTEPTPSSTVYAGGIYIPSNQQKTVKYFAVDAAGNATSVVTGIYKCDDTPPLVTFSLPARSNQEVGTKLEIFVNEPCQSITWKDWGNNIDVPYTGPFELPVPDGFTTGPAYITIGVTATDMAGNVTSPGTSPNYVELYLVKTPLTLGWNNFSPDVFSSGINLELHVNKPAVIYYTLDGSVPTTSSTVYNTNIQLPNTSTLVRATAVANSDGEVSAELSGWFYVDNIIPTVQINTPAGLYYSPITVYLSGIDAYGCNLFYTTDGLDPVPWVSNQYNSGTGIVLNNTTTLKILAQDYVGNQSQISTVTYTIDTSPAVLSITPTPGTYTVPKLVEIQANVPCTIYYTTDGSDPVANGIEYTASFAVDVTKTVKAYAVNQMGVESAVYEAQYVIAESVTQILLPRGNVSSIANADGVAMPLDKNMLFAADDGGHIQGITDIYVGPYQPLAGTRLWHDTNSMTVKYNDGKLWAAAVETSEPRPKNFGGFLEEIYYSLDPGKYAATEFITLESSFGSPVYYTLDGSTPDINSAVYTGPIPMFTGILTAVILTEPSAKLSLAYHKIFILDYQKVGSGQIRLHVNAQLVTETLYMFLDGNFPYSEIVANDPEWFTAARGNYWDEVNSNWTYEPLVGRNIGQIWFIYLCKADGTLVDKIELPNTPEFSTPQAVGTVLDFGTFGVPCACTLKLTHPVAATIEHYIYAGSTTIDIAKLTPVTGNWTAQLTYINTDYAEPYKSLTYTESGSTPVRVNTVQAATVWQGFAADLHTQFTGPDAIVPGVTFARGVTGGFYNTDFETGFNQDLSPINTLWAFMGLGVNADNVDLNNFNSSNADKLNFAPWRIAHDQAASDTPNTPCVVWLVEPNIYLDFTVKAWPSGSAYFEYVRSDAQSLRPVPKPVTTYTGLTVGFNKTGADDPAVVFDMLTDKVVLSRQNDGGPLVNTITETGYSRNTSPNGVTWAFAGFNGNPDTGVTADNYQNLVFAPFRAAAGGDPPDMQGHLGVCHLVEDNIYFDVKVIHWGLGDIGEAGEVTYIRAAIPGAGAGNYTLPTPALYTGYAVNFAKTNTDTLGDKLTANVKFSRFNDGGPLYNVMQESSYDATGSPKGAKFAFAGLNGNPLTGVTATNYQNLIFGAFQNSTGGSPPSIVGLDGVVWLPGDNIYFDIKVSSWGNGKDGNAGVVAYDRATLPAIVFVPPTAYTGLDVTFTKVKADNPSVVKDDLVPTVSFTRLNGGGPLINIATESDYNPHLSPVGVKFAFAGFAGNPATVSALDIENLTFLSFADAIGGHPPDVVGVQCVCLLVAEKIAFDMMFTYWGQGSAESGTMTYQRATLPACAYVVPAIPAPAPPPTGTVYNGLAIAKSITPPDGTNERDTIGIVNLAISSNRNFWYDANTETDHTAGISPAGLQFAFANLNGNPASVDAANYLTLQFASFDTYVGTNGTLLANVPCVVQVKTSATEYAYINMLLSDCYSDYMAYTRSEMPADVVAGPKYWQGLTTLDGAITFDSPDYANQIDSITPTVSLTRGGTGQLYNTLQEAVYVQNVSPLGVKFAFSGLGPNAAIPSVTTELLKAGTITPVFSDIRTANANNSAAMVGRNAVMHLVAEDIYVDIKITRWSPTAGTGGFTYVRATNAPKVTMTVTSLQGQLTVDGVSVIPGVYNIAKGDHTFTHAGNYGDYPGTNVSNIMFNCPGHWGGNVPAAIPDFATAVRTIDYNFSVYAEFIAD